MLCSPAIYEILRHDADYLPCHADAAAAAVTAHAADFLLLISLLLIRYFR